MIKSKFISSSLFLLVIIFLCACSSRVLAGRGTANIVVGVVDESGTPVPEAQFKVRFSSDKKPIKTVTDSNGIANIKGESNDGVILGEVTKGGYYLSGFHHDFFITKFGRFQPWPKEISVVMRPIINPVPMFVRHTYFKVPIYEEEVGFDLIKSDWVIPYGQGTHADFIFNIERRYDDVDNYEAIMTLTFPNSFDGILVVKDDGGGIFNTGSEFKLSRMAPQDGYLPILTKTTSRGVYGRHSDNIDDNNFIFRVRSEVDENGKLMRAMYGKIRGDLIYSPGSEVVGMHYYLNPDYTPNLEFDPKRNLSIVSDDERVEQP